MAQLMETYACIPSTERGRGILISGDPKTNSFLYCNGRSVIIRYLDRPLDVQVYAEHAYQTTVARFSPNGEWIASADVSGTVRIWGTHNGFVLKNEFRALSGRVDDLQWSADGMRIVVSGDGKGKSFIRAFISLLEGLVHLHSQGISHGRLNPWNVLVSCDGTVGEARISGFGSFALGDEEKLFEEKIKKDRRDLRRLIVYYKTGYL